MAYIDLILLLIFGGVTYAVANEGAWAAGMIFFSVLFSALLAMNFFEPLAVALESVFTSQEWRYRLDIISLLGLFTGFLLLFRWAIDRFSTTFMDVHPLFFQISRWGFAVLTGYVTIAFLLTSLHTAPLPREFLGFTPERDNFLSMSAPDRQWLGFTQYVSERVLTAGNGRIFDGPFIEMGEAPGGKYPNTIWPSFPIRYASRRAEIEGSTPPAAAAPPTQGSGKKSSSAPAF